jgi:2-polyprenyl-3-methyl-5-hydroxy-6-metoxy-1,4-benzoquinol methylase
MVALREFATPGLHEEALKWVKDQFPSGCGPVLDLGGGTGAWSARLQREGFRDIVVLDCNRARFAAPGRFIEADLNLAFSECLRGVRFPLITALEVIEHLENPSHFLRECSSLLAAGGLLMLTTPNLESMPGRLKFFLTGRLRHFDQNGDKTHISPIDLFLLRRLASRAGLNVRAHLPLIARWHDRRRLFLALAGVLAPIVTGSPYGACHLLALCRSNVVSSS